MIKFKLHNMTNFARRVLRKMGAVPTYEYNTLELEYHDALNRLRDLYKEKFKKSNFPFLLEPDATISYNKDYDAVEIKIKSRHLYYKIDKQMFVDLKDSDYRKEFARLLSHNWAQETEKVLDEMMEKFNG